MSQGPLEALSHTLGLSAASPPPALLALVALALPIVRALGDDAHAVSVAREWLGLLGASPGRLPRALDATSWPEELAWLDALYVDGAQVEALPPPLLLAALIQLIPPGHTERGVAWARIDEVFATLDVPRDDLDELHGWLMGAVDEAAAARVRSQLDIWASSSATSAAVVALMRPVEREIASADVDFFEVRQRVEGLLEQMEPTLDALHITTTLRDEIREYLQNDRFRLAVMGEFKRGKSTLINALLEQPDMMPAATLPCTSALTEIRFGPTRTFAVSEQRGLPGTFEPSTQETFKKGVAQAAKLHHAAKKGAAAAAAEIPHWRVTLPAAFLSEASISLIDSPGLGEDYARDELTKAEAKRADAAILVFNGDQIASLEELSLIEDMDSKAADMFVVVNKADRVPEADWPRLRAHVMERVRRITDAFDEDRLVFLSAKLAEDAMRAGVEDVWVERLRAFRQKVAAHLLDRIGGIKLRVLRGKVTRFAEASRTEIDAELRARRDLLQKIEGLESARERLEKEYISAQQGIELGEATLRQSTRARQVMAKAFEEALPRFFEGLEARKEQWGSEHDPIISPKKYVRDVARQAQRDLTEEVRAWVAAEGADLLGGEIDARYAEAASKLANLLEYLQGATGIERDDYFAQIREHTFEQAFGTEQFVAMSEDVVGRSAVTGAISLVVGYIVADIILYYVLGIVSGFFNPFLLAAAVIASIPVALLGKGMIKGWIHDKILQKLREEMDTQKVRGAMTDALDQAVEQVFARVARGFRDSASRLLVETRFQRERTQRELEAFLAEVGNSPRAREEELERVERLGITARAHLGELEAFLASFDARTATAEPS